MKTSGLASLILAALAMGGPLVTPALRAQPVSQSWAKRYDGPSHFHDYGYAVAVDAAGNVAITGSSYGPGTAQDYYTAKYSGVDGSLLWEKRYNGPENADDVAEAVGVDADGNVFVTGYSVGPTHNADYYTAKYAAADGALLWEVRYNGTLNSDDAAYALVVDPNGDVIVTGTAYEMGTAYDFYTAKYAGATGALIWEKRINGTLFNDVASALALDPAGNVIVTGYSADTGTGADIFTVKLAAADGAKLWSVRSNGTANLDDAGTAVAVDASGNAIITGYRNNTGSYLDYYTAKYAAADGALLWEKGYNGAANNADVAFAIALDANGNAAVTGRSLGIGSDQDIYTAKYAAVDGALLWEKRYTSPSVGADVGYAVAVDPAGNVVVGGVTLGTLYDYYVAKYAGADGALLWEITYDGPTSNSDVLDWRKQMALTLDGGVVITGDSYDFPSGAYDIATVKFLQTDTVTDPPILTAPATNAVTTSPVNVEFTLPEAASSGTVHLTFSGPAIVTLVLAASQETNGTHTFSFDPANPVTSTEIASGNLIPDGTYTVTLGYQDALGNPIASASSTNVRIDTTTETPTLTAPVTGATVGNPIAVEFTLPEVALPGSVTLSFGATVLTFAASQESAGLHSFNFDPASPTASPEIAGGSAIVDGAYSVTLSYRDALANSPASTSALNVIVDAMPNDPSTTILFTGAKDGSGTAVPGIGGTTFTRFGIPAINNTAHIAFVASFQTGTLTKTGIFDGSAIVAMKTGPAPDVSGATFAGFKDPALNGTGEVAFLAPLAGSVLPATNQGLFVNLGGTLRLVQQKGKPAPAVGGATIKAITSFALTDNTVFFTGTMAGVPPASDTALWSWTPTSGPNLLLREGQSLGPRTVKSFVALKSAGGSGGHGRTARGDTALVRVIFADATQGLITLGGTCATLDQTGDAAPDLGVTFAKFGLPTFSTSGGHAFLATLTGAPAGTGHAIFADAGPALHRVFGQGDVVDTQTLTVFKDPVYNAQDDIAALATIAAAANKTAIVHRPTGSPATLFARLGDEPAGVIGGHWKAFKSLALPDHLGPVFTATLALTPGIATPASDLGLWAHDSNGRLHLLIREGAALGGKTVKTFTVLATVSGSPDQTRAFNTAKQIVYRAVFTDRTQAIVRVDVP